MKDSNYIDIQKNWNYDFFDKERFKDFVKFIDEISEPILDIGIKNPFSDNLAKHFGIHIKQSHDEFKDLNKAKLSFKSETFGTIFICEVLEHLHNPGNLLKECSRILNNGIIYISVPYRPWFNVDLWEISHPTHYNEFREREIKWLLEEMNFKISNLKIRLYKPQFTGLRPLLIRPILQRKKHIFIKCTKLEVKI